MPRFTKMHYQFLAKEVAPLLQAGKADEFADLVQTFGRNGNFQRSKFIDVSATSWHLKNDLEPRQDAEPIDDSIPCLEEPYVVNTKAA